MAYKETESLKKVVDYIIKSCSYEDIKQIVLVVKNKNCPSYFYALDMLKNEIYSNVEIYVQRTENIISCCAELPVLTKGTHFIIMASDMEMDPAGICIMIEKAKENPNRIICASKWQKGSIVEGYGFIHKFGTVTMNRIISMLVKREAKDPVSVFEIFPISVYKKMQLLNSNDFLFEYNINALINGVEYEEIPTIYRKNNEKNSNFSLLTLLWAALKYMSTAVKYRFNSAKKR